MADVGLSPRPHGNRPVKPISRSQLGRMLRDRYYIGYVRWGGNEYPGRHPHLIPLDLFHRVQQVLDSQSGSGIRNRKHHHYLKGTLWCQRCGRRMIISVAKGTYEYFLCRGRQHHECDLPYIPVDTLEKAVIAHYATVTFPQEFQAAVRAEFDTELDANIDNTSQLRQTINQRIQALSTKEDYYLDLVGHPDWPVDKLREKMQHIRIEREHLLVELNTLEADLTTGRDIFYTALKLLDRPQRLYRACTPTQRKLLNTVIFTKLTVDVHGIAGEQLAPPFDALIPAGRHYTHCNILPRPPRRPPRTQDHPTDNQALHPALAHAGHSSSKTTLVPPAGDTADGNSSDQGFLEGTSGRRAPGVTRPD